MKINKNIWELKMNKIKIIWGSISVLLIVLMVLIITLNRNKSVEKYTLPNDVVELANGSIISLSHYYDVGYWSGVNEMLICLQKQNLLRKDTTITIHLDTLIKRNNILGKQYFDKNNLKNK